MDEHVELVEFWPMRLIWVQCNEERGTSQIPKHQKGRLFKIKKPHLVGKLWIQKVLSKIILLSCII